ncbi:MAG: hypothetical protein RLY71_3805 [Pseudomonadota bacterium]|jgi:hypothetical protein
MELCSNNFVERRRLDATSAAAVCQDAATKAQREALVQLGRIGQSEEKKQEAASQRPPEQSAMIAEPSV